MDWRSGRPMSSIRGPEKLSSKLWHQLIDMRPVIRILRDMRERVELAEEDELGLRAQLNIVSSNVITAIIYSLAVVQLDIE